MAYMLFTVFLFKEERRSGEGEGFETFLREKSEGQIKTGRVDLT